MKKYFFLLFLIMLFVLSNFALADFQSNSSTNNLYNRDLNIVNGEITLTNSKQPTETIDGVITTTREVYCPQGKVTCGEVVWMTNTGTAANDGNAHVIGKLCVLTDVAGSDFDNYGSESRVNAVSVNSIEQVGHLGLVSYKSNTVTATCSGLKARVEIFEEDGVTPLAQGTCIGVYIPAIIGGASQLGVMAKDAVRSDAGFYIYDTTGTNWGAITKQTGGDMVIGSDNGSVNFGSSNIVTTGYFTTGPLTIQKYSQDAEPTIAVDGYMCLWTDTDDSNRTYLVYRRGSGDQIKVELQ